MEPQGLSFTQNIDALFANLEEFTKKEAIMGQPVTYGERTLVPVISVTIGYGSGNSAGKNQQNNMSANQGSSTSGMGALGIGAKVSTDAVVVIDNNGVSMLPVGEKSNFGQLMDKIPQVINTFSQNKQQNQQQNQQNQQQGQQ